MAFVAAYEDVKTGREERPMKTPGARGWRTRFIQPPQGVVDHPVAFLVEGTKERVIRPHYHQVDQFQVIVKGGGTLGRHPLSMYAVHFTRAHTPYGPILFAEEGLGFLTLRAHWDPGAQYIPENREVLSKIPGRRPWQATEAPSFQHGGAVNLAPFEHIRDDRGLAAYALTMEPNAVTSAPEVARTNGQYIIVTNGSIVHDGQTKDALTIIFVRPDEPAFRLQAGPHGMAALILDFLQTALSARETTVKSDSTRYRVWQCELCAFAYDEAKGMPDEGIAPGTRWEDVPEDWICPDCGTTKADFQMREVA